jgi:hypothetical protein
VCSSDLYALVDARLQDDGVLQQALSPSWSPDAVLVALSTARAVFPYVAVVEDGGALVLLASRAPLSRIAPRAEAVSGALVGLLERAQAGVDDAGSLALAARLRDAAIVAVDEAAVAGVEIDDDLRRALVARSSRAGLLRSSPLSSGRAAVRAALERNRDHGASSTPR